MVSEYLTDGHGSVRQLCDEDGVVTDAYTYDAWGNLVDSVGDSSNSFLYCGEQNDSFTGMYYLRARYMDPSLGSFITMDDYDGSVWEPVTLHKYLYANANPVMNIDPSGNFSLGEMSAAMDINSILDGMASKMATATLNMVKKMAISAAKNALIGAGIGFGIGTLDAKLGGASVKDSIVEGFKAALTGAKFGAVLGAALVIATYAPLLNLNYSPSAIAV